MGKKGGSNKGKKVNSVFKVAGAKSLKIKNKAKPMAAKMKKIAIHKAGLQSLDSKSQKLDCKLKSLEDEVRQPNVAKAAAAIQRARGSKDIRQVVKERQVNNSLDQLATLKLA